MKQETTRVRMTCRVKIIMVQAENMMARKDARTHQIGGGWRWAEREREREREGERERDVCVRGCVCVCVCVRVCVLEGGGVAQH